MLTLAVVDLLGIAMERLQPPLNMLLYDAYVSKTDLEYKVWLSSFNCEHDLPLFGVFGAEVGGFYTEKKICSYKTSRYRTE